MVLGAFHEVHKATRETGQPLLSLNKAGYSTIISGGCTLGRGLLSSIDSSYSTPMLQNPCEARCLGTQKLLQNHLQKGLEHKGCGYLVGWRNSLEKCHPFPSAVVSSFSNFRSFVRPRKLENETRCRNTDEKDTLQGTNISHRGKNHLQTNLGARGYVTRRVSTKNKVLFHLLFLFLLLLLDLLLLIKTHSKSTEMQRKHPPPVMLYVQNIIFSTS